MQFFCVDWQNRLKKQENLDMSKEIRLEEETFKFVKASDLIEKNTRKVLNGDDLACDCQTCQKRKKCCSNKQDSSNQSYRED